MTSPSNEAQGEAFPIVSTATRLQKLEQRLLELEHKVSEQDAANAPVAANPPSVANPLVVTNSSETATPGAKTGTDTMRILLADDQLDTRQLYSLMFGLEGHTTTLAASGAEAIQAVADPAVQPFDVIVVDIEMPGTNGFSVVRRIRELPHGQRVPIIMFTAYGYSEQEAQEAGADLLVRKPILPQELAQKMRQLIRATV